MRADRTANITGCHLRPCRNRAHMASIQGQIHASASEVPKLRLTQSDILGNTGLPCVGLMHLKEDTPTRHVNDAGLALVDRSFGFQKRALSPPWGIPSKDAVFWNLNVNLCQRSSGTAFHVLPFLT